MEESEFRENIGMRNPYALADHMDEENGKQRKNWKRILLGLDPKYRDLETALRDSLGYDLIPEYMFEPGHGSPLYYENERKL